MRWGLGREEADAEPARDRKPPLPSRWSRSILACARGSIESGRGGGVSAAFATVVSIEGTKARMERAGKK